MKLHQKLTLIYIVTSTLPIVLLSFFSYDYSRNLIMKHVSSSYEDTLDKQVNMIETKVKFYENISNNILLSDTIQKLLLHPETMVGEGIPNASKQIRDSMSHVNSFLTSDIPAIQFYSVRNDIQSDGRFLFPIEKLEAAAPNLDLKNESANWYLEFDLSLRQYFLAVVKPIYSVKSFQKIGYIKLSIYPSAIFPFSEQKGHPEMYVIDRQGNIILDSNRSQIGEKAPGEIMDRISSFHSARGGSSASSPILVRSFDRYMWAQTMEQLGWSGIVLVPVDSVDGEVTRFRNTFWLVSFLSASLFVGCSLLVTKRITKGLGQLSRKVSLVSKGLFEQQSLTSDEKVKVDEIGLLEANFETMVRNLRELINDNYVEKLKKREIELKFLQAQINPHFLYNTLDSIKNEIELDEQQNAVNMVVSLADLFRISVSKGSEFITWEEELHHAVAYLKIMDIRFGSEIELKWDIDLNINSYYTLKVILQPLLENAIRHGLQEKRGSKRLCIRAKIENANIHVAIEDNGVGMKHESLVQIRNDNTGIGLKNVKNRIRHYYGTEYGIHFISQPGVGTVVELKLPLLKGEDLANVLSVNR